MAASIAFRLSGGAANADPALSIGGAMSANAATANTIFDTVGADEASAGDVEYRKIFITNDGTEDYDDLRVWISDQPTVGVYAMALDGAGKNADGDTVADENTAPSGESFSTPTDFVSGLSLGAMAVGDRYAVWLRRTITAGASGVNIAGNAAQFSARGDYVPA